MYRYLITIFLAGMSLGFAKAYIPVMAELSKMPSYFVGLAIGTMTLSWPLFGILSGWLLDKYSRVKVLQLSYISYAIICCILFVMFTFNINFAAITLMFSFFSGVCVVIHENVYMTIPKDLESIDLDSINSKILFIDFLAGSFVGATLTSIFSNSKLINYSYLVIACGTLIASIICKDIKLKPINNHLNHEISNSLLNGLMHLFNDKVLRNITILAFLLSFAFGIYQAFLIEFVTNSNFMGLSIGSFGYIYAIYGIGVVIGSFFATTVSKRFGLILGANQHSPLKFREV